ncbi:MAG: DUF494 family protein [Candidatus Eisenbacteria sp.]|nr:DUF494 family protein [Candidatus Eisenbacteria bacterium]
MDDRTSRLLMQMIDRILAEPGSVEDMDSLVEYLSMLGFSTAEVGHAVGWLLSARADTDEKSRVLRVGRAPGSVRMLHESEICLLTTRAQGYLLQLRELGVLDDIMMERVIQAVVVGGEEVLDREDIAELAAGVILTSGGKSALVSLGALPVDQGMHLIH